MSPHHSCHPSLRAQPEKLALIPGDIVLCVLISRGQRFNHALCLSMCSTECLKQPSSAKPTNAVSGRFCFVVSCAPVTFRHAAERLDAASSPCDAAVMQSTRCCLLCVFLVKVILHLWSFHLWFLFPESAFSARPAGRHILIWYHTCCLH